ncbi:MAG: hypothetical protein EBX35_13170, partial [Planctomycetia bacterium]|nr:hypothetical protein [Planctomycetia bacterium]
VFGANVNKAGAGTVILAGSNSGSRNFSLNAGSLRLNSPGAMGTGTLSIAAGTTLDNTAGGAVSLTGNGPVAINGDFTFAGGSGLNLGTGSVTLASNPTITVSANTLTLGGAVGGSSALTKAGAGSLVLNGAASITGPVSVNAGALTLGGNNTGNGTVTLTAGTLNLGHAGALGTGTLVISGGTINNTSGGPLANANANATTVNGNFTFTGTNDLNLGTGPITLTTAPTITVAAGTLTLAGSIVGSGFGITKSGPGTLTLSGTSTYTGNTVVNAGTLNITGSIAGNAGSSVLTYGATAGNGVVNYNSIATTTLRATVGGDAANSVGVLNLSAGTINVTPGTTTGTQAVAKAVGSYGYLNVTGGTYRNTTGTAGGARFTVSSSGGTGAATAGTTAVTAVMNVSGTGFIDHTNAEWWLNYGMGQITVADSGRIDHTGSNNPFAIFMDTTVAGGSYGVLNLAGANAQVLTGAQPIRFGNSTTNGAGNTGFVNLAAGTLSTGATVTTSLPAAPSTINNAYFNYAGGTIKATASANWVPASSASINFNQVNYGAITNSTSAGILAQVGTASDFSGGVTFDTNTFTMVLANPIQGAAGVGVTQADLTAFGGSGYVGAPAVVFSNAGVVAGGSPAAGYALMSGGAVTGIVITSPGTY